jgi:hypothetical protein
MGRLTGNVFAAFDEDDFRWWIGRLADAGDAAGVHQTMGHRDRQGINAWFAARDGRNEVGGYAGDLDRAWDLADAMAGSAEAVGLQCRYALLRALLGDLGSRFKPKLAALLVLRRVWTREQALAWGRLSRDAQSALDLIADAIDEAEGTRREELVFLALATSTQMGASDNRTLRLAEMARTAAPHEQAALLDSIIAETNSGSRLSGLLAIIPHIPVGLLHRAFAAARAFESGDLRAEALAAIVPRLPPDEQQDAYAEVLATAREELTRPRTEYSVGAPGVQVLEKLAATLPGAMVSRLLDLAREAELTSYDLARVVAAMSCRVASTDPAAAMRYAEELPTGPRDQVLAAAARAYADAGHITEAIAAGAAIKVDIVWAPVLVEIAPYVSDVEDPALLSQIRRLSPYHQIEVVRELAARASGPVPALLAVAEALPEPGDRLRARAAVASALTHAEVAATLSALTTGNTTPDAGALGELAPHLTAVQARIALDALAGPDVLQWDAVTALAVRLADLGAPDEALAQVTRAADPAQLNRPEALATLASHLPERLLPAVEAALQPSSAARERVAASTALLAHLSPGRAADVIAEAAALEHPAYRAQALAKLVSAGHAEAEPLLAEALRDTCASRHLDRHDITLQAVRTVAAADVELSREFADAVRELPSFPYRLMALLALACSGRSAAARTASAALVDLLLYSDWTGQIPDDTIEDADTACLAEAILAVPASKSFAVLAASLAPLLRQSDRSAVLRRVATIKAPEVRLQALAAVLPHTPLDVAGLIAAAEHARSGEWSGNPELLPLALEIMLVGGINPDQELLERGWAAVLSIGNPATWLTHVARLANAHDTAVPSALLTKVLSAALRLDAKWRWPAVTALAPRLGLDDLRRVLPLLNQAPSGPEVTRAAAACAARAAELGDEPLMLAFLTAARTFLGDQDAVSAADRLPSEVLPTAADHAAHDPGALAAIAATAAARGDHRLALEILSTITSPSSRETAVTAIAARAQSSWAEDLLPAIRQLWEGPRAEALAELIPKIAPERRAALVEEAVRAAHEGYRFASAPKRRRILISLAPELTRLPAARLAQLWKDVMHLDGLRGRDEVLVDVAALAGPVVEVFGSAVALELDKAIRVSGADQWP